MTEPTPNPRQNAYISWWVRAKECDHCDATMRAVLYRTGSLHRKCPHGHMDRWIAPGRGGEV